MMKILGKKNLDYLTDINEKKIKSAWQLNFGVMFIVILSISIVGINSFRMISDSILKNTKLSSIQLVKQTAKNIETVLSNLDNLTLAVTADGVLPELVSNINTAKDEHKKAEWSRQIREIMNNYVVNRADIADIVVITNSMDYITSGELTPNVTKDVSSYNAVKLSFESNKDSMWIDPYVADADWTFTSAGSYGQVLSLVKKIYTPNSLESQGLMIVNYKESYLYNLVSDVKVSDGGKIYLLGRMGNYVMNQYDRALNGYYSQYDLYFKGGSIHDDGSIRRKIEKEDYIITFDSIKQIAGTPLDWKIILLTPEASVTTGITNFGKKIFFFGLGGVTFGFIFSLFLIRRYRFSADKKYSKKHSIMMEQERLASLGQLIGGIAHNFKTPIMSIAGGLEALKDLAAEYESSIEDASVNENDHREIAAEMRDWVKKIRPYCSYMSDVISAVKGQAVNCNESSVENFIVKDLVKRVEILMNHELKRYQCQMNIDLKVDDLTEIKGEINNLVQVLNNLISNSIEAYNGTPGNIDILFSKKANDLEITVKDYGSGIPEKVKNKLLKEMITTKGDKGTGIGLYMSYSTIKGKFAGTIRIESEQGKGTSVIIIIPLQKK